MGERRKLEVCFEESKNHLSRLIRTEKEETQSQSSHSEGYLRGHTIPLGFLSRCTSRALDPEKECQGNVLGPWHLAHKKMKSVIIILLLFPFIFSPPSPSFHSCSSSTFLQAIPLQLPCHAPSHWILVRKHSTTT